MENKNTMRATYNNQKKDIKTIRKSINKLKKRNEPLMGRNRSLGEQYIYSKNCIDIQLMSEMIGSCEYSQELIEGYLDFDERVITNKKHRDISSDILSPHSLYGLVPDGELLYSENTGNTDELLCNVELQEEVVSILEKVLTKRQQQVVNLYFWEDKNQEQISQILGIAQKNVSVNLQNAIKILQKFIKLEDFDVFY